MVSQIQQYCTFYLDDHLFGVEVESVQEVIRYHEITRVPRSADMTYVLTTPVSACSSKGDL